MNLLDTTLPGSFASTLYCRINSTWLVILPLIQSAAFHRLQPPISNNLFNRNSLVRIWVGHSIHEAFHWCLEAGKGPGGWEFICIFSDSWSVVATHPLIVRFQESNISRISGCSLCPWRPAIEQSEPNYCTGPDIKLAGIIVSFLLKDFR